MPLNRLETGKAKNQIIHTSIFDRGADRMNISE